MKKNKRMNFIAKICMLAFLGMFLLIASRFIYIQTTGEAVNVNLNDYKDDKRETSFILPAERGKIFDQNGNLLAYNRPVYKIYAVLNEEISQNNKEPLHVVDEKKTAEMLAPLLEIDEKEISDKIKKGRKESRWQIEFGKQGRNIPFQKMEEISALELPGVYFMEESTRYYANGIFASHIIGFTREDEAKQETEGIIGLEKMYNESLTGTDGFIRYQTDKENVKLIDSQEVIERPKDGQDIYLTIDQKIQTVLEDLLTQAEELYEPESISAVAMNPTTGEILAMSNRPSFNPNSLTEMKNWYNDVISTPIEPGSTMKIFTWAAAIDTGVYKGEETFKSGQYKLNPKIETINDHNHGKGWGKINYNEGFARSSNVAASKLMWEKIGPDTFHEYLKRFGFDEATQIDLPNEVPGHILFNWPSEKLRTAFGQGSTFTAIQQMKAASALVNDGKMVRPYVVKKIVDPTTNKIIEENEVIYDGEPIKQETAKEMIELLDDVVNSKHGTGKIYQLDDYSVIGKTGTAQIPDSKGKGYLTGNNNYVFSFLGMAPKENPQIMVHVAVKQPKLKANQSGAEPVALIANNVIENGLRYLNIEPDIDSSISEVKKLTFPQVIGKKTEEITSVFKDMDVDPIIIGDGKKINATNFAADEAFYSQSKVMLITDKPKMPDITNWSHRDVTVLAELLNIDLEVSGTGFVNNQSIKSNTDIKKNSKLTVELKSSKVKTKDKKKSKKSKTKLNNDFT